MDQLESECNVSTPSCQTPRECQTRSSNYLKKSSMDKPTQQIPAITELDLPQSGSEDDDETWLTGSNRYNTTTPIKVAAEAINAAEACQKSEDPFHQHSKTQPVAEPALPRTPDPATSANAFECGSPGPLSRDDDEDSSPIVLDLDLADHVPCSNCDMTTSGHENPTLTHSLGASALGSETSNSKNAHSTDSDRKVTPECSPHPEENAKLTHFNPLRAPHKFL